MDIKRLEETRKIWDEEQIRFKEMGNITEVLHSEHRSHGGFIKKLDKDTYLDNRTGEVCEFKHLENRAQDLNNVAKSLSQGRDILNTNITDVTKCRWITFTYRENMTDPERLALDFKTCIRSLRKTFGNFEYITAAEPQGRGAWHLHAVFIFDKKAPYMKNKVVADAWKQGFVTVKRLDDVDNVGAYLTAYLGDMELSEATEAGLTDGNFSIKETEVEEGGKKLTKRYVKGARLRMYPPGFHIFRWSKGIKKPTVSLMSYGRAKEKISSAKLTFSKTVKLEDVEKGFQNTLTYEYYNKIRK